MMMTKRMSNSGLLSLFLFVTNNNNDYEGLDFPQNPLHHTISLSIHPIYLYSPKAVLVMLPGWQLRSDWRSPSTTHSPIDYPRPRVLALCLQVPLTYNSIFTYSFCVPPKRKLCTHPARIHMLSQNAASSPVERGGRHRESARADH